MSIFEISDRDMALMYSKQPPTRLGFIDGYRACEGILVPQLERYASYGFLDRDQLLTRLETCKNVIEGKDKLIRDYKGFVDTVHELVCERNALISSIKEYALGIGDKELLKLFGI
jgi:hypothetical protein